jgi:CRISPR-associated exonuclease Cas4
MKITGTAIYYFFVCKKKLWYYLNQIREEYDNDLVQLGKLYHDLYYKDVESKNIIIEDISIDFHKKSKDEIIIYEVKKSKSFLNAARWQLIYYLTKFAQKGLKVRGILTIPKQLYKEEIEYKETYNSQINQIIKEIEKIYNSDKPPNPNKGKHCEKCAYYDICYI